MSVPQKGGGVIERRDQLAQFLADGEKPKHRWRIGTEHEKFGFRLSDRAPLPYEGPGSVRAMLEGMQRFGWEGVFEGTNIIGLKKDAAAISLEPGGQFELSGAPLRSVHETCDEVNQHLDQVRQVASEMGAGFLGLGFAPTWRLDEMPQMPKGRYQIMRDYMPKVGRLGLDMMFRTCTVQVNLDYASEADMTKKLRVALALQPVATALFANSPLKEGKPNGFLSYRSQIWTDTDKARSGMLPCAFEDGFGYERYVDYALDVPMYFVYRDGKYLNVAGQSFRAFLDGKLPALPGEKPTLADWADHLTTIFTEARVKKIIEMRGADGGPWKRLCALPAFWVGLMYDESALDAAWDLAKNWTAEERMAMRLGAPKLALRAPVPVERTMRELAREALDISTAGLRARARADTIGDTEEHFLHTLRVAVDKGCTPAEEILEKFHGPWRGDASKVFGEYAY